MEENSTEGPDNGKISYTNRHNQKFWGENDKLHYHHVYFDIWGNTIDKKAVYKADIMARKAISTFKDGDCGLAAFYLG